MNKKCNYQKMKLYKIMENVVDIVITKLLFHRNMNGLVFLVGSK